MAYLHRLVRVILLTIALAALPAGHAQSPGNSRKLSRWLEFQTATIATRYRYQKNSASEVVQNQDQYQDIFRGRFKFDGDGRYSLNAGVATGRSFTSGWNDSGWGMGEPVSNHYLKQLYLSAAPARGLELHYGGLYLLRGESTEITTYDNDGYMVGERLTMKRPGELFFDEISITYGYLGDVQVPNLNKRFHRLKSSNYHQFLVAKEFGSRAGLSAGYTFVGGVETLRQAVRVRAPELRVVDLLRFEDYQRTDVDPDFGFAVYGEKALKRLTLGGGYADIDPHYGGLNGDRFLTGRRLFVSVGLNLNAELSVLVFATHAVKTSFQVPNATRLDVVVSYNLLQGIKRVLFF